MSAHLDTETMTEKTPEEMRAFLVDSYKSLKKRLVTSQTFLRKTKAQDVPRHLLAQFANEHNELIRAMVTYMFDSYTEIPQEEKDTWEEENIPRKERYFLYHTIWASPRYPAHRCLMWYKTYNGIHTWEPLRTIRRTRKFKEELVQTVRMKN